MSTASRTFERDLPNSARSFVENFPELDEPLAAAYLRSQEVGYRPMPPSVGSTLAMLAAAVDARTVVELGTGTGCGGLWLLRGMRPDGVLTTIDTEPEFTRLARRAFTEAQVAPSRVRLINGDPAAVLPRLADGSYDLFFLDATPESSPAVYGEYLASGMRLLRDGGVVAVYRALGEGRIVDPMARDPRSMALRELVRAVRDDPRLTPAMLPVGDGLLTAVKR